MSCSVPTTSTVDPDAGHPQCHDAPQPAATTPEEQQQAQQAQRDEEAKVLNDLAVLKLSHGEVQEAQVLLQRAAQLRMPQLVAEATRLLQPPPAAANSTSTASRPSSAQAPQQPVVAQPLVQAASAGEDDWESKDWEAVALPTQHNPSAGSIASATASVALAATDRSKAATPPPASRPQEPAAASKQDAWAASREAGASTPSAARHTPIGSRSRTPEPDLAAAEETLGLVWDGGFEHCVEVHNLTTDIKTADLQVFLDEALPAGTTTLPPFIRWANDNHAVLVCGDGTTAKALMEVGPDFGLSIRPFSEASQASKQLPISELLPPKPRPKTTAAVAKKLLSHALGMPQLRDRNAERELATARRAAKQERAQRHEGANGAWDDE